MEFLISVSIVIVWLVKDYIGKIECEKNKEQARREYYEEKRKKC